MKSKNKKISKIRYTRFIIPALLLIQFVIIGVLAVCVYWQKYAIKQVAPLPVSGLIIDAVDNLSREVKSDPQTGKVYIYEARLVLPATEDPLLKLRYNYTPAGEDYSAELRIVNEAIFQQARVKILAAQNIDDVFKAVPKLQACSRGYHLSFEKSEDSFGGREIFTKKLKDSRTLYVYLEDTCGDNSDKMIPYLKQIDSY